MKRVFCFLLIIYAFANPAKALKLEVENLQFRRSGDCLYSCSYNIIVKNTYDKVLNDLVVVNKPSHTLLKIESKGKHNLLLHSNIVWKIKELKVAEIKKFQVKLKFIRKGIKLNITKATAKLAGKK